MSVALHTRAPAFRETPTGRALGRFVGNKAAVAGFVVLVVLVGTILLGPTLLGLSPNAIDLLALNKPPSAKHWLGTDGVGRDVFARLLEGGRISLSVALGAVSISLVIGFLMGALAAFGGKLVDAVIMRIVDLAMTLPPIVLLLVLASITGPGIGPTILVIALLSWPILARLARARLLELRERDFVLAARNMGAGTWHLVLRHGLPNTLDVLVVYATLQIANAVLLEAGLSFLGLGVPPPDASWGNMLNGARSVLVLEQFPWQWLTPGVALVVTVMATNFVGDGLRDAFDPRSDIG
jgi:peptide/nickel transport system permease protein